MDALFTFAVSFTDVRPIQVDQHTAYVVLAGVDSAAGLADAQQLAVAWVHLKYDAEMVTRVELVSAAL